MKKIWDWIVLIGIGIFILTVLITDNKIILSVLGVLFLVVFSFVLLRNSLKWIRNSKKISNVFIKLNKKSSSVDYAVILSVYLNLKNQYISRETYLNFIEKKDISINNYIDFLNSYEGIEKFPNYFALVMISLCVISIILNIFLKQVATSEGILFNDGELIKLNDVSKIKVQDSFFGFSKNITIESSKVSRTVYLKK